MRRDSTRVLHPGGAARSLLVFPAAIEDDWHRWHLHGPHARQRGVGTHTLHRSSRRITLVVDGTRFASRSRI